MIPYILSENNKGIYIIPKKDLKVRKTARILRDGKEHEPEMVKIIVENSHNGVVVHAGAYIGDMIPAISKGVKTLVAFEPNKEAFNCAMAVRYLNNCDNTCIYNVALSEKDGDGVLDIDQFRFVEHINQVKLSRDEEVVQSVTIDSVIGKRCCSVIHLDVELHEISVLKGAINTIKRDKPLLIIEDLYGKLNSETWFVENILNHYKEIKKIGLNSIYKC